MKTLSVDIKNVLGTVSREDINKLDGKASDALEKVLNGTGEGSDFLGWVNLPTDTTEALLDDIVATADSLRQSCDTVVAIGIGGSYLGAKAVIEALSDSFAAYRPASEVLPGGTSLHWHPPQVLRNSIPLLLPDGTPARWGSLQPLLQ